MAFSEALTVTRRQPIYTMPDAPFEARLAPFTPDQAAAFIPAPTGDVALEFMPENVHERFADPELFTAAYRDNAYCLAWGVHTGGVLAGVMAAHPNMDGGRGVILELFLDAQHRGQRLGELATAGALRAAFTPNYLRLQAPHIWRKDIHAAELEIDRSNEASKRLAQRFGFMFLNHRKLQGTEFWANTYKLPSHVLPGDTSFHERRINRGVRQAHSKLSEFKVVSDGIVTIANRPGRMLRPVTQ